MTKTERPDICTQIASRIADMLDEGVAPWRRPWSQGFGLPVNASTGRAYSGINVLALLASQMVANYPTCQWVTYKQAQAMGGQVRKGEKGTRIAIVKRVTRKRKLRDDEDRAYTMMRSATVFNVAQVDGLDLPEGPVVADPIDAADSLVAGYFAAGPSVSHGGDVAAYSPSLDAIRMPPRAAFDTPADYYATLFHEVGHSTGHRRRLDRDLTPLSKSVHDYSREELVAEFAAAFLCGHVGIEDTLPRSAAYLRGWASKLRDEPAALRWAAARAQEAYSLVVESSVDAAAEAA